MVIKHLYLTFVSNKSHGRKAITPRTKDMKHVQVLQLIKNIKGYNYKVFSSLSLLKRMGLKVDLKEYKSVWQGDMDVESLDGVFARLQGEKPEGYDGHSLSVSDIVVMDGKAFYCDSYGWAELKMAV